MEQHADEPGPFQRCAGQRQAGLINDDAAKWLDKSIATKATFGNLATKANALAADGKKKEAVATAEKALAAGAAAEQKPSPEAVAALEKKIAEWKK